MQQHSAGFSTCDHSHCCLCDLKSDRQSSGFFCSNYDYHLDLYDRCLRCLVFVEPLRYVDLTFNEVPHSIATVDLHMASPTASAWYLSFDYDQMQVCCNLSLCALLLLFKTVAVLDLWRIEGHLWWLSDLRGWRRRTCVFGFQTLSCQSLLSELGCFGPLHVSFKV